MYSVAGTESEEVVLGVEVVQVAYPSVAAVVSYQHHQGIRLVGTEGNQIQEILSAEAVENLVVPVPENQSFEGVTLHP